MSSLPEEGYCTVQFSRYAVSTFNPLFPHFYAPWWTGQRVHLHLHHRCYLQDHQVSARVEAIADFFARLFRYHRHRLRCNNLAFADNGDPWTSEHSCRHPRWSHSRFSRARGRPLRQSYQTNFLSQRTELSHGRLVCDQVCCIQAVDDDDHCLRCLWTSPSPHRRSCYADSCHSSWACRGLWQSDALSFLFSTLLGTGLAIDVCSSASLRRWHPLILPSNSLVMPGDQLSNAVTDASKVLKTAKCCRIEHRGDGTFGDLVSELH